jgi:hypothetical protein
VFVSRLHNSFSKTASVNGIEINLTPIHGMKEKDAKEEQIQQEGEQDRFHQAENLPVE